jgi:DNA mismatch repair protein MutS
MLNECLTPMGKRKFSYSFLNPTTNIEYLKREYNITEYLLKHYKQYNALLYKNLSEIKDISKWERQVFLKKITPKSFCSLYNNIKTIKSVYEKIKDDSMIILYLKNSLSGYNVDKIGEYCDMIMQFIYSHIDINLARDIETTQGFDINFIVNGVDQELDKNVEKLIDSELRLDAVTNYLSNLIESKDKPAKKFNTNIKNTEFVKIHETEKTNISLVATSRRCKLLQEALPVTETVVSMPYNESNNNKKFDFKVSKSKFEFTKQSASNMFIEDDQINGLCKNISQILLIYTLVLAFFQLSYLLLIQFI